MTSQELFNQRLFGDRWMDMVPRMHDLRRYGSLVSTVTEFGCRTGNSTSAFIAGGASVVSYDIEAHSFDCPEDATSRWRFIQADTAKLDDIEPSDLIFFDSLHQSAQVESELKHARRARRFLLFHDVIEWGWNGERDKPGILHAILPFLARNREWAVKELLQDKWGILVLERLPEPA